MARMDPSANSARTKEVRPAAVLQKHADNVRSDRDEERVSSNIVARPQPATESHAALSASLHESFGNTMIQSALAGSLEGPAPLISAALTLGAAGLGPDSAHSGSLSNSGVAAYLAARDALPTPEIFAQDADSRVKTAAARGGKALPEFARNRLEAAFGGADFSGVRLHVDGAANQASKAINAKAYTVGQHVYLGHGYDNLQDRGNLRLLIHELTHVVQHMEGRLRASTGANQTEGGMAISSPTDAVELEAENMATSLLPGLDGSILAPMDAELSLGQGMELGAQSAEVGEQSAAGGSAVGAAAMRSRDDDNSALDKQSQGDEQNQDQVDGRQNDQESLEGLGEWKSTIKAQNEKMEALGERIAMWDSLEEAERKTLWREALAAVLVLSKVALQAIGAALESSEAGLKLGAKLQAVGSVLSLVGWALGDSGPSTGEVKDERTKENKDSKDPTEPRFTAIVGWVQETIGEDTGVDFGAQALGKVLEGARKLQDAMTAFLEGIEALTSGVNDLKQVKDQKEGQAAKDSKKLDSKQIQKTLSKLSERSEALSAKLSGDAGAEKTPDTETETGPTKDQASTNVADTEQEDAALNGLGTAAVKAHGAALQNAPKKLQRNWSGQLQAGTNLGVEKPTRRWTKVKVLDGDQKGAWGYVDRHFFKGRNKEPGRAATKEKRLTRPTRETLHRNASGAMSRSTTSERPAGGGQALPKSLKEAFRPILGRSIDSVRIHTDGAAADFAVENAANAITVGRDIYFAPGTFSESGNAAKTLLAEELHHAVLGGGKPGVSQPGDDHERKARAFAEGTVGGGLLEVIDATFGESLSPGKAQGRRHHPRRALQTLKNAVPTKMLRQLGDALGTSQGSGLKPGAPGVGLRHMGVGGTPKQMRAPKLVTPSATPTPDKRVGNRNAAVDTKRRAQMDKVFGEYENMSFAVSLTTDKGRKATVKVTGVETPYRINGSNVERSKGDHKAKDAARIPKGTAGKMAAFGKASASQVQTAIQGAIKAGTVTFTKVPDKWLNRAGNKLTGPGAEGIKAKIRAGLRYKAKRGSANLLGVDCSGFTYQIILRLAQAEGHKGGEWGTTPLNVGTGTMKTARNMRTITAPGEMRTADLMLFGGHVEAIYSITAINAATWKKEGTGDGYPKNGGVWKISTMESSPDGSQREGTRQSTWYVMQTVTERAGQKPTSKVQFWKNKGTRTWHSPTVKVRRAKLLEETEAASAKDSVGEVGTGLDVVQLRGTISRNAKGSVARNTSVPLPQGGGQALPAKVIEQLSTVFGKGLSQVRVHTGKQAQAASEGIAANAFTNGMDIFFNKGMFNPQNEKGLALLAEELHHALVGGGGPGVSQPGDAHEKAAGSFVEQLLNPNKQDPSVEGGASGAQGLSRQEQEGATAAEPPDVSGYTEIQLQQVVYNSDGQQRYRLLNGSWTAARANGISPELFEAAWDRLQTLAPSTGTNRQVIAPDATLQGDVRVGDNVAGQGPLFGGGGLESSGRDRIIEGGIRQATDGRRYAVVEGENGTNRIIWGTQDTSSEEMRALVDERLPGQDEEQQGNALTRNIEVEGELFAAGETLVDEALVQDGWNNAEGPGGSTRTGEVTVGGVEVGVDARGTIGPNGVAIQAGAQAELELVHYVDEFTWNAGTQTIGGETFGLELKIKVDAFVGAEARVQLRADLGGISGGPDQLAGQTEAIKQRFENDGSANQATASAGVFAGARIRLGAGAEVKWHKKAPQNYASRAEANVASMIAVVAAPVPGLSWVLDQIGVTEVIEDLLGSPGMWGEAGPQLLAWVEAEVEGSAGVGANASASIGFDGGKFHMNVGANATWGLGFGVNVGITFGVFEGARLGIVIAGELSELAVQYLREKFQNLQAWGRGLLDSIWSWLSSDDRAQEAVENDAHQLLTAAQRGQLLDDMGSGWTGEAQQNAMAEVLRFSKAKGDLSSVVSASGWSRSELRSEVGSQRWVQAVYRNASAPMARQGGAMAPPQGGGQALPEAVMSKFQPLFGAAMSEVRVHTDSPAQAFAQSVNANAVTVGTDIFFNKSTFDPGSVSGLKLMAEEIHHAVVGGGTPGVSQPSDAHEQQALGFAERLVGGGILETIDGLLGANGQDKSPSDGADQAAETVPQQLFAQLQGQLPPAIQTRLRQQLGLAGESASSEVTAQGSAGASRQELPTSEEESGIDPVQVEQDAQALLSAFTGAGTTEAPVYRVLGRSPAHVRAVADLYDSRYNVHTGNGLIADIVAEFDGAFESEMNWDYVVGLLTRAGLDVPSAPASYQRMNEAGGYDGRLSIHPSPRVETAAPNTNIRYSVDQGDMIMSSDSYFEYQWFCINDPAVVRSNNIPSRYDGPSTAFWDAEWDISGTHTVFCRIQFHGSGQAASEPKFIEFVQRVAPLAELAGESFAAAQPSDYMTHRAQMELQLLQMTQNGVADQAFGTPNIRNSGPNPAVPGRAPNLSHHTYSVTPSAEAHSFRWYATAEDWSLLPTQSYYGYNRTTVNGESAFDMGTGETASFVIASRNVFTIFCEEMDVDGNALGTVAQYRQVVTSSDDMKGINAVRRGVANGDEAMETMDPTQRVGLRTGYVNEETGAQVSLTLFAGAQADGGSSIVLLDLTPGVSRIEYSGATIQEAIADFDAGNSYPTGIITVQVPGNESGLAALTQTIHSDGSSTWAEWAANTGWAALGLAVLGIGAALVPGGQGVAACLFVAAAGAGAASSSMSIYDNLQQAEVDGTRMAIDILGLASSILGGAAAFRAARQGGGIIALANQPGRFLVLGALGADAGAGVLMTIEGITHIEAILQSNMSDSEKVSQIVRILGNLAIVGGLIYISARSARAQTPVEAISSPEFSAVNPGPLPDNLAGTFGGGRYREIVLAADTIMYRAGKEGTPLGQFFSMDVPQSVLQTRIDKAVLPVWPDGGTSPLNAVFAVKIPAGTTVYTGAVGTQGGFYVGGTEQIVVRQPWTISGVEVVGTFPLQ